MNEFDYLAKAKSKMENENYFEVISLCDKALNINSELPEAYHFRGNARFVLGEYDSAASDFSQAIKMDPNDAEHYYDRSWAYKNMDKLEDAIVDMNKALEIEPKTSLFYYDKARLEYEMGRYKEAAADYTKGIELKPTENKYIGRGNCYLKLEEYDLALADYNSAIEIAEECFSAYYRRGILYSRTDQFDKAIKDFEKTLEFCPYHDDAMAELGYAKIQIGKKDVMKYFNKAIELNPCVDNYCFRIYARADILKRQENLEKLSAGEFVADDNEDKIYNAKQARADIRDLNKAIIFAPDDTNLYKMRAKRYQYLEKYNKAIKDYTFLIESNPEDYINYTMRAFCNERAGFYEDAINDCLKSVELNQGYADEILLRASGMANYKLCNYERALVDFSKLLELKKDAQIYYLRGLVNSWLINHFQAYFDFAKALELNPDIESDFDEKIPLFYKLFLRKKQNNDSPIGLSQMNIKE